MAPSGASGSASDDHLIERLREVEDPVALLAGIFAHSPVAFQIYRADGHCLLTNPAFRALFGVEPPPEYNVLEDDIARATGLLDTIRRAFAGETVHLPPVWYDPRELEQIVVPTGKRVAIESTFFPLRTATGAIGHVAVVFRNVTTESVLREQAERERDLLTSIIEQSGDGIIVADADGSLRIFNRQAEKQHGVGLTRARPPSWSGVYGLRTLDGQPLGTSDTPLYRALNGERIERARWVVERPDGSRRILSGTAVPLHAGDGSRAGAVLITRDETDRLEDERRLERALALAESASRAKDEFLAMLGHELRNPLSPIVTALDLMKLRADAPASRELQVIERQVEHLVRLVDDLLDVSRITRGKVDLARRPIDLQAAVVKAVEMAAPLFEQRQHRFRVAVPPDGMRLHADVARLAQIISNLLTNAARYTPPGGSISLTARREGDHIVLSVIDDGIGIDPALLPSIFDLFVQGERSAARAEGGLGIGLTLVHNLVRLHGGTVEARSDGPGAGSEFVVRLPALPDDQVRATTSSTGITRIATSVPRRIIVVDDNTDAADLTAALLARAGHEVHVAHDGPTALSLAARVQPDIALLDIGLPVMDGYELAARLRATLGDQAPHLIAITGYGQDHDHSRSAAAGFTDHLVKPVPPSLLLSRIDRLPEPP